MYTIEDIIDFATWLSEQEELDVDTPDHAVRLWLHSKEAS